ncbi:MAG: hypothetical protein LBB74_06910 [Chitinispirillales bacterium]|jgi:hypothetical protein|nr:hypothetical protein [Chitinispirillales bacterium]
MMCRVKKSAVLALAAVGIVFAQSAPSVQQWQNLYPAYSGLVFDGDKFVAVSGDGLIRTTVDGEAWQNSYIHDDEGKSRRIYAVACGGGRFLAMQNSSRYLYSGEGVGWAAAPAALSPNIAWKYIVYGVGSFGWEFVAVDAAGGTARYDEDDWDIVSANVSSLSHAAYGGGKFVVAGDGIKWSGDARGWGGTSGASSAQIAVVAFGDGKFVALSKDGNNAYTSEDAQNWTSVRVSGASADMADMVFGGGKFVAVGKAGNGCFSSNGTSWTSFTLNLNDDFTAVKYGTAAFLALGAKGSVYKSQNGETWSPLYGNSVTWYRQIAYGNNKYVAVGDSGVSVSSDGIKWERKNSAKNLTGVAFGANKFVAVSDNGTITFSDAAGETWTDRNVGDAAFTSVAFGGTTFIAGGRTSGAVAQSKVVVHTSTDGDIWSGYDATELTGWATQGEYIVSLCSAGDRFIAAVGGATKELKECGTTGSNVGKYWSSVPGLPDAAEGYSMISAVYADNKFVVLGTNRNGGAMVINSADATGWTPIPIPNINGVRAATYAMGYYIAAGDSGNIYAHINGAWIQQGKGTTNRNLSTVYAGNNAIIAAGAGGVILHSTAEPTPVRYTSTPRPASSSKGGVMSLSRFGRASAVTLSFTPNSSGAIAVYSLSGRQLYKARLGAGERIALLPERVSSNGSVIVRYSGDGRIVSRRLQFVR